MSNFYQIVSNLRACSEVLLPYTYPKEKYIIEQDIFPLRNLDVCVDGYGLCINICKADYGDYFLETIQIYNNHFPFLPFYLVVKIGRAILGDKFLSLIEFFQGDNKIYCWSICTDKYNEPVLGPFENDTKTCSFEGFEYRQLESKKLDYY